MILWLASYPRSGNTLLRTMLQKAFGLSSYSVYDDDTDLGLIPEVRNQVGHQFLGAPIAEFYQRERNSPELKLVKTHDPPVDDGAAIYVIRDGRSAIVSRYNMLVNLRKRSDISITDVILGRKARFGHWTGHIRAWEPRQRPKTLLLFYHDLLSNPGHALTAISGFIGRQSVAQWHNNFDELHRVFPEFFNRGSDEANVAQMTQEEQALFWTVHGDCMREYGFSPR